MDKKTLEEKIHDVIFWTIVFFILYLIIGYLLESSWLSKMPGLNKIYDLLKDGLSITAAFLAPVAAFILFSDWREPHLATVKDEVQTNLLTLEFDIRKQLYLIRAELSNRALDKPIFKINHDELFEKLITFKNNIKRLERLGFVNSIYVKNINEVHEKFSKLKQLLITLNYQLAKNPDEMSEDLRKDFDRIFKELECLTKDINEWELSLS